MTEVKRIYCLANSRKMQGRCIAGREMVRGRPGLWIRPISSRPTEEVSEYERQYADGSDPRVLDIIDVPLLRPQPKGYQSENWVINPFLYWSKVGQARLEHLDVLVDTLETLWISGHSTYHGQNDRIPLDAAAQLRNSLRFIVVDFVQLRVFNPGEAFGSSRRVVQARFAFSGLRYALRVTDPEIERAYLKREDGYYDLDKAYMTISLGEPYRGFCYKLVAALMPTG